MKKGGESERLTGKEGEEGVRQGEGGMWMIHRCRLQANPCPVPHVPLLGCRRLAPALPGYGSECWGVRAVWHHMKRVSTGGRTKKVRGWVSRPGVRLWAKMTIPARTEAGHCNRQEWAKTKIVFRTCFTSAIVVRPAGHAKVPAEVPEDSRVLRERHSWFPTSDRLESWLIPSGTNWSRQYHESTMVWRNLALYHLCKCLLPLCHTLFVWKDKTKYWKRWYGGMFRQTMADSWYCLDWFVPEKTSQFWRGNTKRRSLNTRLSSGTSAGTSAGIDWFSKSGWLIHECALCTRIAHLPQWGPKMI